MAERDYIEGRILGSCIREFREVLQRQDSKWTQAYVGERIGMDSKHYGKIERGKYPHTSFTTVGKIATALNCSLDTLWGNYTRELTRYKQSIGEDNEQ